MCLISIHKCLLFKCRDVVAPEPLVGSKEPIGGLNFMLGFLSAIPLYFDVGLHLFLRCQLGGVGGDEAQTSAIQGGSTSLRQQLGQAQGTESVHCLLIQLSNSSMINSSVLLQRLRRTLRTCGPSLKRLGQRMSSRRLQHYEARKNSPRNRKLGELPKLGFPRWGKN